MLHRLSTMNTIKEAKQIIKSEYATTRQKPISMLCDYTYIQKQHFTITTVLKIILDTISILLIHIQNCAYKYQPLETINK